MMHSAAPSIPAQTTVSLYERRLVPLGFDVLISTVFLPFGGVRNLRSKALDLIDIRAGAKVLELGCGTGGITRLLLARGANVMAIDGSSRMLERARGRAPGARFEQQQLESLALGDTFDTVLFAFVLHELPGDLRIKALQSAAAAVAPTGVVAILDHAVPRSGRVAIVWRRFLLWMEGPGVSECIEQGYDADLRTAGLGVVARHELAKGTAALVIARRGRA